MLRKGKREGKDIGCAFLTKQLQPAATRDTESGVKLILLILRAIISEEVRGREQSRSPDTHHV